jgi:hypothetical protein
MLTILGNMLFLLGSVAFLEDSWEMTGVWLFIVGSVFMVIDSYRQRHAMMVMQRQLEQAAFAAPLPTSELSGLTSEPY